MELVSTGRLHGLNSIASRAWVNLLHKPGIAESEDGFHEGTQVFLFPRPLWREPRGTPRHGAACAWLKR